MRMLQSEMTCLKRKLNFSSEFTQLTQKKYISDDDRRDPTWDPSPRNKIRKMSNNLANSTLFEPVTYSKSIQNDPDPNYGIKSLDWLIDFNIKDLIPTCTPNASDESYNSDMLFSSDQLVFFPDGDDLLDGAIDDVQQTIDVVQEEPCGGHENPVDAMMKQFEPAANKSVPATVQQPPLNKLRKPPFTYTELIEHALREHGCLTVSEIYQWISDHFPYYSANDDRWKNSVRHNLSINPVFRKGRKAAQGAGHLWELVNKDQMDLQADPSWLQKQRRIQHYIDVSSNDETARATASIMNMLSDPTEPERTRVLPTPVTRPYVRPPKKTSKKTPNIQLEFIDQYAENQLKLNSNKDSIEIRHLPNFSNVIEQLNTMQNGGGNNFESSQVDSRTCPSAIPEATLQIGDQLIKYMNLEDMHFENGTLEQLNIENIENVNIENINFDNISIENIKCMEDGTTHVRLNDESWIFLDGDFHKIVLNESKMGGEENVTLIAAPRPVDTGDFLNPVSKEQVVEECGLLDKNGDLPPGYMIDDIPIENAMTEALFSAELSLHHLQPLDALATTQDQDFTIP